MVHGPQLASDCSLGVLWLRAIVGKSSCRKAPRSKPRRGICFSHMICARRSKKLRTRSTEVTWHMCPFVPARRFRVCGVGLMFRGSPRASRAVPFGVVYWHMMGTTLEPPSWCHGVMVKGKACRAQALAFGIWR